MNYIENIYICLVAPILIVAICAYERPRKMMLFVMSGMTACLLSSYISTFLAAVHGTDSLTASAEIAPMVEECMKLQGRFRHCFKPGNEWTIEEAQKYVDSKWEELLSKVN